MSEMPDPTGHYVTYDTQTRTYHQPGCDCKLWQPLRWSIDKLDGRTVIPAPCWGGAMWEEHTIDLVVGRRHAATFRVLKVQAIFCSLVGLMAAAGFWLALLCGLGTAAVLLDATICLLTGSVLINTVAIAADLEDD